MSRVGRRFCGGLAAVLLLGRHAAAEGDNANVFLYLDRGVQREGTNWVELELEFPLENGKWPEAAWGYTMHLGRGLHQSRILKNETVDNTRRLTIEMDVCPDNWQAGGWATYEIEVTRKGRIFNGTFTGKCWRGGPLLGGEHRKMPACLKPGGARLRDGMAARRALKAASEGVGTQGTVRGRVGPAWPGRTAEHRRPAPGEHPRLVFRKHDIPRLRQLARETAEGKAILARALQVLGKGGGETDKFTTWPAVGYGFAYVMTGKQEYADEAREIVRETIFANATGRQGKGCVQDIHHGPRLQGLALAFDLCYDGWAESFRLKCIDEIQRRTWELRLGEFEGKRMSGYNPNPWSNHNAIRVSCAGLGALAVLGEKNSQGNVMEDAEAIADLMAWEAREHFRTALGGGAYCMEGSYYKVMTLQRGFAHFLPAYENVFGRKVDAGPYGDWDMAGYFIEGKPGELVRGLDPVVWSVGMHTVPEDMLPGVKWLFDRAVGLKGDRSFGIAKGIHAPFIMANYPYDVKEKHPGDCFRWMSPDPRKGHWVFRPTLRDKNDIMVVLNMKSENLRGSWAAARSGTHCLFDLWGFGRQWFGGSYLVKLYRTPGGNQHLGGVVTSWHATPERTCVINWNMDRAYYEDVNRKIVKDPAAHAKKKKGKLVATPGWYEQIDYGTRATRSMAVDCSGASGAPLLVALVERVDVPKARAAGPETAGEDSTKTAAAAGSNENALRAMFMKETGIEVRTMNGGGGRAETPPDATTRWSLPMPPGKVPPMVRIDGNRFKLGYSSGPTIAGVFTGPAKLRSDVVMCDGRGDYFCVFTLQDKEPPFMLVEGEGLDAVVRAGNRTVRYDGEGLVLERTTGN